MDSNSDREELILLQLNCDIDEKDIGLSVTLFCISLCFRKKMLGRTDQEARMRLKDLPPDRPPDNTTSDYGSLTSCDSIR